MTTEPPRPDQIQANVAAALSRLRGELAPTPPAGAQGAAPEAAPADVDHPLTSGEALFDVKPGLQAPDPSMALNQSAPAGESPLDTPFARMTGIKLADQPDLLTGIGAPPLADLPDAEIEAAKRKRRLRNRLLAGAALVIVLGAFWIFSGGDSGNQPVPVITADGTPEKVKPADEGGLDVPNQDVAILNGENSTAPSQGETVLPAPEQPATPPAPEPEPAPAVTAPSAETTTAETGNVIPSVAAPAVDAIPTVAAPTELSPTEPASAATSDAAPAATSDAQPAATSEAAPAEAAAPAAEAAPTQTATAEPAAVTGSTRIQLAAVKTEAAAQKEWARIQKAHPDVLGPLTLHVEKFNKTASEVFYRIQAGPFQDRASAKQACAELINKDQACIVAK